MVKCTHICVSESSNFKTNYGGLIVEIIKHLLRNINNNSHVVHLHFNPKQIMTEREFKQEARVTETYFDTPDLVLHNSSKKTYYKTVGNEVVVKEQCNSENVSNDIYYVSYKLRKGDSHIPSVHGLTEVAKFDRIRHRFSEYLYYDEISWGNNKYYVGTVVFNNLNLGDNLNIVRRFPGYYQSKLFHYWSTEKQTGFTDKLVEPWSPEIPIEELLKAAALVYKSNEEEAPFLLGILCYVNSIVLQAAVDSSLSSSEQTIMVDIFYRTYKFATLLVPQDCTIDKIIAGLANIYLLPNFEDQYKMDPSKFELMLDVAGYWESISPYDKLIDLNIVFDDEDEFKYALLRVNPH